TAALVLTGHSWRVRFGVAARALFLAPCLFSYLRRAPPPPPLRFADASRRQKTVPSRHGRRRCCRRDGLFDSWLQRGTGVLYDVHREEVSGLCRAGAAGGGARRGKAWPPPHHPPAPPP